MNLAVRIVQQYDEPMSYVVVKTIKGRRYRYLQTSWREGHRVRTRSVCLGPIDGSGRTSARKRGGLLAFLQAQCLSPEDRALVSAMRQAAETEKYQRETFGETAVERADRERQEHLDKLHDLYGMKIGPTNPTPIDKLDDQPTPAPSLAVTEPGAAEGPEEVADE